MNGRSAPWLRLKRLWLPPAVATLVGAGLLLAYRLTIAEDAESGRARLDRRIEELETLRASRQQVAERLAQARATQKGLEEFYGARLQTEARSLTRVIAEIKQLAQRAGLAPGLISYDLERFEEEGLVERTMVFSVAGPYHQLRQLINFLELSNSFVILEQVAVSRPQDQANAVNVRLRLSTLFAAGASPAEAGT